MSLALVGFNQALDNLGSLARITGTTSIRSVSTQPRNQEAKLGPDSPQVVASLDNIALVLIRLACWRSARPNSQRLLTV